MSEEQPLMVRNLQHMFNEHGHECKDHYDCMNNLLCCSPYEAQHTKYCFSDCVPFDGMVNAHDVNVRGYHVGTSTTIVHHSPMFDWLGWHWPPMGNPYYLVCINAAMF